MTAQDTYDDSPDDTLAAEYVLHVMSVPERQAFEARLRDEPELQALVRAWESHFVALADEIVEVAPPPQVKAAVDARVFGAPARRRRLGWVFGGLVAASAILAMVLVTPVTRGSLVLDATHSVEVASESGDLVIAVTFSDADGALVVQRSSGAPEPGRAHEMWLIPEGAEAPVSLGVIPAEGQARVAIPDPLRGQLSAAIFAVSDEPDGGSPTGQPTGAVLAAGPIQTL